MTTLADMQQRIRRPASNRPGAPDNRINMSTADRVFAAVAGPTIVLAALRRPSIPRLLVAALGGGLAYLGYSGHSPGHTLLGINTARRGSARPYDYFHDSIHVEVSCTIAKPAEELYRFWRDFENLPRIMRHVQSVRNFGDIRSHWVANAPAGTHVEWDAEIQHDEPNRLISWRSLPEADVDNTGSVRFLPAPGGRGTEVHVILDYIPPAGFVGAAIAKLFGEEPRQQVKEDLRHFKQIMEAGEVPTIEGQPRGTCEGVRS